MLPWPCLLTIVRASIRSLSCNLTTRPTRSPRAPCPPVQPGPLVAEAAFSRNPRNLCPGARPSTSVTKRKTRQRFAGGSGNHRRRPRRTVLPPCWGLTVRSGQDHKEPGSRQNQGLSWNRRKSFSLRRLRQITSPIRQTLSTRRQPVYCGRPSGAPELAQSGVARVISDGQGVPVGPTVPSH